MTHGSISVSLAAPLLYLAASSALADGEHPWCDAGATAPGCTALHAINEANRRGDYTINCLSIPHCAPAQESVQPSCPPHAGFREAVMALRADGGAEALSALESVCWESIETTWKQREQAARFTRERAAMIADPPHLLDSAPLTESQYTAWTVHRAADATPRSRYVVRLENDSFGHDETDSNYTMGLSITGIREGRPTEGWMQRPMLLGLEVLNRTLGADTDGIDASVTTWWRFGSADYTPRRIKLAEAQPEDTPYASLVYFTAGYFETHGVMALDSSFELAVLGTNVGREVQTAIHKVCCQENIPRGWDHQIGSGGSLTFLYHVQWSRAIAGHTLANGAAYELRASAGGELGYYTRALAGATLHLAGSRHDLGRIRSGFLPVGEPPAATDGYGPPRDRGTGLSLWLEYEASAFAHNELLQGAWSGPNDVTHPYSDIERYVWRTSIGIELTALARVINPWHQRGSRFYFTQQVRSRELVRGPAGSHSWGGFYYSWEM